jgi:hypothetical protein
MADQQRNHNRQFDEFFLVLFYMQTPDLNHIFQELEMHIFVMVAFMFKQQVYTSGAPYCDSNSISQ